MKTFPKYALASAVLVTATIASAQSKSTISNVFNSLEVADSAIVILQGGEAQASLVLRGVSVGVGNKGSVYGAIVAENGSTIRDATNVVKIGKSVRIVSGDNSVIGAIVAR